MGYIAFAFVHLSVEYFCEWFVISFPSIWYVGHVLGMFPTIVN